MSFSAYRILVLKSIRQSVPFALDDCIDSFYRLGHEVKFIDLSDLVTTKEKTEDIIASGVSFRPHFLFTIDYVGFIPHLFTEKGIPLAAWFLDEPMIWLEREHLTPLTAIFVVERMWMAKLRELGCPHIFFLPVGTNPRVFRKYFSHKDLLKYECNISFAGDSLYPYYLRYFLKIKKKKEREIIKEVMRIQSENPTLELHCIFEEVQKVFKYHFSFKDSKEKTHFEIGLRFAAMSKYRRDVLERVSDLGLIVYGGPGWKNVIDTERVKYLGVLPRGEIPKLFQASKINLNIMQAPTTLPMRIFDVPAAGGFLISDFRPDILRFFELDKEIVCFFNKDDLRAKAQYFLKHPREREEIARRAQRKTLEEHTYEKRMERLISVMKETFNF
jgi:spore maturation protein CgeB